MYQEAFQALRNDRQFGAFGGRSPIFYVAISRYAEDHDIRGSDFVTFHKLLCAMDDEYLIVMAERDKQAAAQT